MRVLVTNDLPSGGAGGVEQYLERLVAELEAAGDDVELFAGEVRHEGVRKVLDVWDPWARRAVAERARHVGAQVVHHHNVVRELSAAVLGATPGIPTVLTVHDHRLLGSPDVPDVGIGGAVQRWVKRPLDRRVARRTVDHVIAVSGVLAARLRAVGFSAVTHIPLPGRLPEPGALSPPSACHDVVYAGRLSHDKGVLDLLEVFGGIADHHPGFRLRIAGDGPLRGAVEQAAARVVGRVEVLGRLAQPALAAVLSGARVVVVPSRGGPAAGEGRPEGASMVVVEAALHGRPVVVGADPAVREVAGALGVTADAASGMAAAIERLLVDGALADRLGERGRAAAVERHDPARVAARVREVHALVVRGRR